MKDEDKIMNIWISCFRTVGWRIKCEEDHHSYRCNFCSCKKKAWKIFRLVRDFNPWPLQYWCSTLTTWANKPTGSWSFSRFVISREGWRWNSEYNYEYHTLELWDEELNVKKIITVIDAIFTLAKRKPEKYSGVCGILILDLCDTVAAL